MNPKKFTNVPKQETNKTEKVHFYEEDTEIYPFTILEERTTEDEQEVVKYKVTLGNKRCDEKVFDNLFSCEEYITSKPYSLITALFIHLSELLENYKQQQQLLKQQLKSKKNEKSQSNS